MNSDSEQVPERRYARVDVDFPVTVIVPGQELVIAGRAIDLSRGGMRVATPTDVPPGQAVILRFSLGDSGDVLLRGRIVLSFFDAILQQYAHGVAFTQYAPKDREALERFVDPEATPQSPAPRNP